MRHYLLMIALCCASISFAQNKPFKISGTVVVEADNAPLESATVYLERVKDSTLVSYTISDKNGKFSLEDKTTDERLNLYISYVGYRTYVKTIDIDKADINLSTINLQTDTNALDEVIIRSRAPITIKKDTLEFNVKSFKTKKDANVEDLLKKLPGVEVDEEGKITVNGKEVNKILVNGKPFFGNDPTITTRNLTKELIEKVQITDTKTKAEAFAGEEGNKENKTINLTIKEENNKGVFGRVAAGGGTDDRYEFAGMLNVFDNDQRISVLAGGNNINSSGFSFGEITKMFGRGNNISFNSGGSFSIDGRSFGGGQGITKSQNYGANYADKIGDKLDISADYFFDSSRSNDKNSTQRENILPDSRYFTNSNSRTYEEGDNHRANLGFDIEVDSTFLININPSFASTNNKTDFSRDEVSRDKDNIITNQSNSSSFVETTGKNFSIDLDLTKRFGNKGAYIKFSISKEHNTTETDDYLISETNIFGTVPEDIIRDQFTDAEREFRGFNTSVAYRLPLKAKELFLDFKYSYRNDNRENIRSTYDFDDGTLDYSIFNMDLSTDFEYTNKRNRPALKLTYRKDKLSTSIETGYVFRSLENKDLLRPELSLTKDFEALELRSNFRYRFSAKKSINFGYNLSNDPPNLSQLQPFQDVSNPLNKVTGNPNLEPSNNHRLNLGYRSFDFQKGTGLFGFLWANIRNNQVVANTTIDENFVRNTTFANVDGAYDLNASVSFSKTIKIDTLKTFKYRAGLRTGVNRNINFNNGKQYASNNTSVTPNVRLTYTWKNVLELMPSYRLSFNRTQFDLDNFKDQEFLSHSVGLRTTTFVPEKFEWRNDISFNYNPNIAPGFQKSAWSWNSTLAYSILKDQGTLTLKAYDLLNQNTNARRIATSNYIQDSQSTVLQRYFMLSFSWKFNTLGSKGESRGGRMMMMH